ncbi:hypothetical protein ACFL6P_05895 [Candidatus Latescibacterota bacterium]
MSVLGLGQSVNMARLFGSAGMQSPDAGQIAGNIMRQRDTDGDFRLNVREANTLPYEFDGSDTNGDGLININELIAKINSKMSEVGISTGGVGGITKISQLKYMVAKMSLDLLIPASQNGKSGYDFESLLIDQFNVSGIEANTLIETMKGNPLDLFG